ncbi:PAQR family membrane homeostasis protein TrhA [Peptacetobacter sp.]|uniref:PAQR family membrane homeostasis protein TrhA n=1 Tax=Peptacetobacter sp. TaxID=2991975 RepID=UPI002612CEBC|nr:hemolysin III family protein [Peptacetobacter sp.]
MNLNNHVREAGNGFTHLLGAILSFIGLLALVIKASINTPNPLAITSVIIFGTSMILLYTASTVYHLIISSDTVISWLRKIDHSMIFLLIAGSYAPFCLISLKGKQGYILFSIVSIAAIAGICFKLFWFKCPRWISTIIYIAMGWVSVVLIVPLYHALSLSGLLYLILGGLFYTIGAIIYASKPKFLEFKNFGFHEIFHIFIMLGSLSHFICVFFYVL